jgi:hypothetical protein
MFFHANDQIISTMIKKMLLQKKEKRERLLKEIIEQWNIFIFVWQVWKKVTNEELGGFCCNYEQLTF